jgi:hypothetical protein
MTAKDYWAGEFSDEFLDGIADLGELLLENPPETPKEEEDEDIAAFREWLRRKFKTPPPVTES